MELKEIWDELQERKLNRPVSGSVQIVKESNHPVEKLRRAYRTSLGFTVTFLIIFIALFFIASDVWVRGSTALVIMGYIVFLITNLSMYRKMSAPLPVEKSLIGVLEHTHDFITRNIRFQERVGLYVYPFALTCGFLTGGSLAGVSIEEFISDRVVIILFFSMAALLIPVCFYAARKLYALSYGKCLTELAALIHEMKKEL